MAHGLQVELATLEYVWWWNNHRLREGLGYSTPVEVETAYYSTTLAKNQPSRRPPDRETDRNETQGDSSSHEPALRGILKSVGYAVVKAPRFLISSRKKTAKSELIDAVCIATMTTSIDGDLRGDSSKWAEQQTLRVPLLLRTKMTTSSIASVNWLLPGRAFIII